MAELRHDWKRGDWPGRNRGGRTIASLNRGDFLEFKCGHCGRTGRLTYTELQRRRVSCLLAIDDMVYFAVCKRCGRKNPKTRVWAIGRGWR